MTERRGTREFGRRKEDQISADTLSKIARLAVRYNWIATLLLAFMLALGFGFKTPKDAFNEIHTEINKNTAYDSATFVELRQKDRETEDRFRTHMEDMQYIKDLVEGMAVRDCQTNYRRAQEALIPCSRLFRERGLQ